MRPPKMVRRSFFTARMFLRSLLSGPARKQNWSCRSGSDTAQKALAFSTGTRRPSLQSMADRGSAASALEPLVKQNPGVLKGLRLPGASNHSTEYSKNSAFTCRQTRRAAQDRVALGRDVANQIQRQRRKS